MVRKFSYRIARKRYLDKNSRDVQVKALKVLSKMLKETPYIDIEGTAGCAITHALSINTLPNGLKLEREGRLSFKACPCF